MFLASIYLCVQRVDFKIGNVLTIVFKMDHCDGICATIWGKIVATEKTTDGPAYEIFEPLGTTEH